ncbi:helix-turn-helix transcriptional regulator [Flammeovirga sp. OC4]|uniref:helix-turn-helix domain-containing protein n=1 Tax=Flammeovirga sp. OC4 TaxID=1382345 RepID=UPI0007C7E383|nr:helix-turn-helix transcriptional regulator [Flammeovirga sp. OC4]
MPSKYLQELMSDMPKENEIFVELSLGLINLIHEVLEKKGWTQKDLAKALGKRESEVSKWLTGSHNFTFRSISKLMAALDEKLLEIPKMKKVSNNKEVVFTTVALTPSKKYSRSGFSVRKRSQTTFSDLSSKAFDFQAS